MKVSTLRAVRVAGLVGLPLIALLAVALFFTLGNANTDTAEAGFSAGMELTGPAFVEVGEKFSIGIQTNPSPNVEFAGFAANVLVSAPGLKYNGSDDCAAEVKVTINSGTPATCLSQVAANGGHLLAVLSQVSGTPQRLDQSDPTGNSDPIGLANLSYTCNEAGQHTATLTTAPTDPDGAGYADTFAGDVAVSPDPADVINIKCTEPAGVINITKTDDVTGALLGGTCWLVSSTDPSAVQTVLDSVSDNNAKTATCGSGSLSDGDPAEGSIQITISGLLRLEFGDTWTVAETQAPAKYAESSEEKNSCDFASENPCVVAVQNSRVDGNITVNFFQIGGGEVPNEDADGQCATINPGSVVICENDEGTDDDTASATLSLGVYTVTFDEASVLADAHQLFGDVEQECDLTAESFDCKVTFSFSKGNPQLLLDGGAFGNLANIFLTDQAGAKLAPKTCADGTDGAAFDAALQFSPTSLSPKDGSAQVVAAWEIQVRFDPKMVCVNLSGEGTGTYAEAVGANCVIVDSKSDFPLDGIALIRCQTLKADFNASADQSLPLVSISVSPQPEVYSIIRANQENGIVTQVLVQDVRLSDSIGHAIKVSSAQDAEVTIRYLEGDVNGSCAVDALDEQTLAFRWGSSLGSLVYNERYDLEPSAAPLKGDGDIDINDIQFVFGRHGSSCTGEQNPAQPPVNPKAQV